MNEREVQILLIEDSSESVRVTLTALRAGNVANPVHVALDGDDGLDFLFAKGRYTDRGGVEAPRLILLDLGLPTVHGIDVLRQIREDERTKSVPVIILTESQEERGVMQSYKLGAQGCIVKPFTFSKFVDATAELNLSWLLIGPSP